MYLTLSNSAFLPTPLLVPYNFSLFSLSLHLERHEQIYLLTFSHLAFLSIPMPIFRFLTSFHLSLSQTFFTLKIGLLAFNHADLFIFTFFHSALSTFSQSSFLKFNLLYCLIFNLFFRSALPQKDLTFNFSSILDFRKSEIEIFSHYFESLFTKNCQKDLH